jgi:hypothetical protein
MRKIVLSVVACCAVIAIVPASALAHGEHHKRHHRAHHARVHHRNFGGDQNQGAGQNQNQDQNAGTVQSFTGGVLTIALNNGQTVSGDVTNDTEIRCEAAENDMSSLRSHDRGGDNGDHGDNNRGDNDQGDDRGDDNNDNDNNVMCSSTDLTPGTVVHEAELRISSAGAVWDKVELVTQSPQSSGS